MSAPEDPQGHVGVDPDEPPTERFRLAQEPDGSVGLTMWDAEGRVRLRLGLDKYGGAARPQRRARRRNRLSD